MARHVDLRSVVARQDGSAIARERVAALLQVIDGTATMDEAAQALGISIQRLHELRERMIAGAVLAAEPQAPGRPRSDIEPDPRDAEIAQLKELNDRLRFDLDCAFLRTELSMAFGNRLPSLKNEPHHGAGGERLRRRERRRRQRQQGST